MAKFTFLELHLDDATITNNAPYSGVDGSEEAGPSTDGTTEDGGGRSILRLLALSVALAVVAALAARAVRGGDDQALELNEE